MQKLGWQASRLDKTIGRCLTWPFRALLYSLAPELRPLPGFEDDYALMDEVMKDHATEIRSYSQGNERERGLLNDQVMEQRRKMLDEQLEGGTDDEDVDEDTRERS